MADQLPPDPSPMPDLTPEAVPETPFWNAAPVLGPPPQIPMPGPVPLPTPAAQDPKQHILTLAALGMMMGMGPRGGVGAAQGLQAAQAHMDAEKLRQFAYQQQVQQHQAQQAQAQQLQANQLYQQREAGLQRVLLDFNAKLKGVTSQEDYDTLIQNYSGALQAGGYRGATPDWFRHEFKWTTPKAEALLQKAVDKVTTSEPYKKLTAENPDAWKSFVIQVAVDPKHPEVKTPFTLPQAYAKLGIDFGGADAEGVPAFVPIGKGTEEQNYIIEAKGAFDAQFHRPPKTPADNTWIMDRVATRKADAAALKKDPALAAMQADTAGLRNDLLRTQLAQQPTPDDAKTIAQQLVNKTMAPSQLQLFGGFGTAGQAFKRAVLLEAQKLQPGFNLEEAEATYQLSKSPSFQNTIRYMDSVVESMPRLQQTANNLANGNVRFINGLKNLTKQQLNNPTLKAFQTDVLLVGDEVAKILQGGGSGSATSDAKLSQAAQILNSADSPRSIAAALKEIQALIGFRRKALTQGTYMARPDTPVQYLSTDPNAGQPLRRGVR